MEDQRLSRMYATLLSRHVAQRRQRLWIWIRENRSSLLLFLLVLAGVVFALGYRAHVHGKFQRLKTELRAMNAPQVEAPLLPGGQEAILMQRTQLAEGTTPEFLSATLFPGRGLEVFQIMVSLPGRGPIALLDSPSVDEAVRAMSGTGTDANGAESLRFGAPIEAPWSGAISGIESPDSASLTANWRGRNLSLPVTDHVDGTAISRGGLLLKAPSDSVKQDILPDGGTVHGGFSARSFDNRWPSQVSVSVSAVLSSRYFELKLVARNEGKDVVPVGLGWHPRIVLPSGDRTGVRLRLPAEGLEEIVDGRATGKITTLAGTAMDFADRRGKLLRNLDLDATFVNLKSGFLDNGPMLELRDPRSGVGLRMTAMSPQIRAVRVRSAASGSKVTIGFQTNYDDPFSRAWSHNEADPIDVLEPGQTLQWRVRMELFPTENADTSPL